MPPLAGGTAKPLGSAPRIRGASPLRRNHLSAFDPPFLSIAQSQAEKKAGKRQNKSIFRRDFVPPDLP